MVMSVHLIWRYNEIYLALTHTHTHKLTDTQPYILIVFRAVTNQQRADYTPCIHINIHMYLHIHTYIYASVSVFVCAIEG